MSINRSSVARLRVAIAASSQKFRAWFSGLPRKIQNFVLMILVAAVFVFVLLLGLVLMIEVILIWFSGF